MFQSYSFSHDLQHISRLDAPKYQSMSVSRGGGGGAEGERVWKARETGVAYPIKSV